MRKGERLQKETHAKEKGKVSRDRAEQKSSKYDGGFIELIDEKAPSKEVETEKLSDKRPSEEGFFSDSNNIQTINIANKAEQDADRSSKVKSAVNQAKEKINEERASKTKSVAKENEEKVKGDRLNQESLILAKTIESGEKDKTTKKEKQKAEKIKEEKSSNRENSNEKKENAGSKPKEEKQIEGLFSGNTANGKAVNNNNSTNKKNKSKKSVKEKPIVKNPIVKNTAKEPVVKAPIIEKSINKENVIKEPIIKKAIDKKPIIKEPINKKSTDKKPIIEEPIVKKPTDKKPVVKEPIAKKPTDKKPIVKEPIAKKPIDKKPIVKEPIAKKPIENKQMANKPVPPQKEPRKPMSKGAKMLLRMGIPAALLLCVYVAGSIFYSSQFINRTFINGYDFSRTEPAVVARFFEEKGNHFAIKISGIGGLEETITGDELDLSISDNGQIAALFEGQSSWRWPIYLITGGDYEIDLLIDYNEVLLADRVAEIVCVDREITIEPVDAKPVFNGESFEIQEEVLGTLIDPVIMMSHIQASMSAYGNTLDLYEVGAYIRPAIFSNNPSLIAAVDRLNHYVGASITYDLNPKQVVVNHEQIVDWLSWDGGFNVTFHEEMARGFMDNFIEMYSTRGSTRSFTNPLGKTAEVESDFFGWLLDGEAEVEIFLSNIRNGETVYREPAYITRGSFHENGEWGDTYVQVCMTTQHLWYFENGEFVLESPIVTGLAGRSQTPAGIFEILWMASPTVLRGPIIDHETGAREWESPVSYWMAITWCGIGLHDATWQPYFGGNRWTYGGSRGCINMPLGQAGELYRLVGEGTMVIVHW